MKLKDKVTIVCGSKALAGSCYSLPEKKGQSSSLLGMLKRGEQTAEEIRHKGGKAIFVSCDVSNEEEVKSNGANNPTLMVRLILVNNAGVGIYKSVLETTSEEWDRCLNIDPAGRISAPSMFPHMQAVGKARSSTCRRCTSHANNGAAPYSASRVELPL